MIPKSCAIFKDQGVGVWMTKADIIESVYKKLGISKKDSAELVELVFSIMKDTLAEGKKIKISGFGNFVQL